MIGKSRDILCFILASLFLVGCNSARHYEPPMPPTLEAGAMPMIVDTDMSVDDWIAIAYLLQRSDVSLMGITVVGTGIAHCEAGVENAQGILALGGRPEIPVSCGRETPLEGDRVFPKDWRSDADKVMGVYLPENPNPPFAGSAVELITQTISEADDKVVIVTMGPLTNIAEVLEENPALGEQIERIVIDGGAVEAPGNVEGQDIDTEWNFYIDPVAASIVLDSGVPVTLVPLDAAYYVPVTPAFYKRLEEDRVTPNAEFVYRALGQYQSFIASGTFFFWDPLTAVIATGDDVGQSIESRQILVDQSSGQTIESADGSTVDIVTEVDPVRFEDLLVELLNGREP
jgi:inosine-uridine nucleoside N-ribohydrolase